MKHLHKSIIAGISIMLICAGLAPLPIPTSAAIVEHHSNNRLDPIQAAVQAHQQLHLAGSLIRWRYLLPSAAVAVKKPETADTRTVRVAYTIQSGDTLYGIAQVFGISLNLLLQTNTNVKAANLRIGQTLFIPMSSAAATAKWLQKKTIKQMFVAKLTAYTADFESTGKRPSDKGYGITSSGALVREGRTIAVDPKVIPIGSIVYIEGVGYRKAEDTGSAIKGPRIDIYIKDLQRARKFGVKKNVKVFVL